MRNIQMPCISWHEAAAAGVDEPDSGTVRKRNTTIGYLPQTPELDEGLSAIDAILHSGSILARCVLAYERAIASGNQKVKQNLL
jgi:ATPase subunit of ABC transporter with duplicated ATPase domains